jgi:uncharacterized protein (UPF0332 family)
MSADWKKATTSEMIRSHEALDSAELLLKAGMLKDAVTRAYYAVFHAARAALATRRQSAKTHSGILRVFSKEFVKTGFIEAEYARVFSSEQEDREFCDYDASFRITKDTAQSRIQEASEFVERIERFLKEQ